MYIVKSKLENYYVKINSNGLFWVNKINATRFRFKIITFLILKINKTIRRYNKSRDYKWIIEKI
jgi:hypothetical protein